LCVPLGLKKPGDFTVSEGIRLQIFRFFGGWVWSEGKKKGRHGRNVSDRHGHPLVQFYFCRATYPTSPILFLQGYILSIVGDALSD
jgi:hypothetical protein